MGLAAMVENLGHEVVGKARNGKEAITLAGRILPDLIITDIKMPGMDGLTALETILAKRGVPVIVLTAYSDTKLIQEADELGVAAYLAKPVSETALKPAIALAVSRYQQLQLLKEEVGSLKDALEDRKMVERAKGIIMEKQKLSEGEAFRFLQKHSSKRNMKMAELSRMIINASELF